MRQLDVKVIIVQRDGEKSQLATDVGITKENSHLVYGGWVGKLPERENT